ncbi:MAG TPA: ABC transporter permease [Exilispira sp.]|nr:ABC transporter permease [Exilispira sp.]
MKNKPRLVNLFIAEGMKYWFEIKRYFFNTISSLLVIYIIFLVYFFGIKFISGPAISTNRLDAVIIGYMMWMLALIGFQGTSYLVYDEMQRGTFEQMYMSSLGLEKVFFFRVFYDTIFSLIFSTLILLLTMITTGRYFTFNVLHFLIIFFLSIPSMWGLGFIFGGIALIFKKISSFLALMQFVIIVFVAVDGYPFGLMSFLPFAAGASSIQHLINNHGTFPLWWYPFLLAISIFYLILGILIFRLLLKKARKMNLLGQY